MAYELETCDECGRDFRVPAGEAGEAHEDLDEMLCPRCLDGRREDANIAAEGKTPASEAEMQEWLAALIEESDQGAEANAEAETFKAAGVLTMNKGLVVRFLGGGAEFQITIVRSR